MDGARHRYFGRRRERLVWRPARMRRNLFGSLVLCPAEIRPPLLGSNLLSRRPGSMQGFKLGLFVAVTAFAVASSTASAEPVTQNGRIVFVRARCGQTTCKWRIVTATARGR